MSETVQVDAAKLAALVNAKPGSSAHVDALAHVRDALTMRDRGLPWDHEVVDSVGHDRNLFSSSRTTLGRIYSMSDADFIVTAVNSHHALVEAARAAHEEDSGLACTEQLLAALKAAGVTDE